MGLFSSKISIKVSTSVSRVIEDKLIPESPKVGLIKGIMNGGDQIVEHVLEELSSNISIKAERMYRYGEKKYIWGLPNSTITSNAQGMDIALGVLRNLQNEPITVQYNNYGPFNNMHYAWQRLVDQYGYDASTNEIVGLSGQKGAKVYLNDMIVVFPEAMMATLKPVALEQWGTPPNSGYTPLRPISSSLISLSKPTPAQSSAVALTEQVHVIYVWAEPNVITVNGTSVVIYKNREESMIFEVPAVEAGAGYFQAKYYYETFLGKVTDEWGTEVDTYKRTTKYFTYRENEGTYPELDDVFKDAYADLGSFFPFVYFRYGRTSQSTDHNWPQYKSTKKLLKYLNMDYASVSDAINENPDIQNVEQAMMIMAVPAETTNIREQRYLFEFFRRFYIDSGGSTKPLSQLISDIQSIKNGILSMTAAGTTNKPALGIIIQDKLFKMALGMDGVYRVRKPGSIGHVGFYNSSKETKDVAYTLTYLNESLVETTAELTIPVVFHYYRKQITEHLYEELQVVNLEMLYYIFEEYTGTADTIMIPLDHSITKFYSNRSREELYSRSLHYVFNSKVEIATKWYQQGWFKTVLIIVAIVITVISMGGASGIAASLATLASMTAMEIVVAALIMAIEMIVMRYALKLFVKMVGVEFAIIIALVAAAFGIVDGLTGGGLVGAPFASTLLKLSTGLINSVGDAFAEKMLGLQKEADLFGLEMVQKEDALKEANKLLEGNNLMSPWIIFGESPSDYYNRTIHSGNIGTYSIEAISSYVDNALTLPTLTETLEGF